MSALPSAVYVRIANDAGAVQGVRQDQRAGAGEWQVEGAARCGCTCLLPFLLVSLLPQRMAYADGLAAILLHPVYTFRLHEYP